MYYQNYDDYMRDVFYFNQMPNQNFGYPYNGYNFGNGNVGAMGMNPNSNMNQNLNNMYPSIYRIVQPVVSRVVTGNSYGYMTEDNLNSMVDTVFNIVENDVMENSSSIENTSNNLNQNQRSNNSNPTGNNNSNSGTVQNVSTSTRNNDNNQNSRNLLKDLIKILLIKEILNRNNIRRFANNNLQNYQFPYDQRYVF